MLVKKYIVPYNLLDSSGFLTVILVKMKNKGKIVIKTKFISREF